MPNGIKASENEVREILILDGIIYENGTVTASDPWYRRVEFKDENPDLLTQNDIGDYFIVLLDSERNVLSKMGFNVSFWYVDINNMSQVHHTNETPFLFTIEFLSNTRYVEVLDKNDTMVLSRVVSLHAPTVEIIYPNGGENLSLNKEYTITWTAQDLDGDTLEYNVYCKHGSSNEPTSWILISPLGIKETHFTWNTSDIYWAPGDTYKIRVVALDGINQGEDPSNETFILSNTTIATMPDNTTKGTPGFELILVLVAVVLVLFWQRKRI